MTAASTRLLDPPPRERSNFKIRRFRGKNRNYYWNIRSAHNGEVLGGAADGDGFRRALDCLLNMHLVTGFTDLDEDES